MNKKESLLDFPCDFPLKVMGRASEQFELEVVTIIRKHTPDLGEAAITTVASSDGNFLSLTANIRATSQEQLDAIYQELGECELVLMAF